MNTDTTSNEHAKTGPNIDSGGLHPAGTKHHAVQTASYLQCRLHRTAFAMIPFGGSSTASSPHLLRSTGFTGLSAYFSHIGYTGMLASASRSSSELFVIIQHVGHKVRSYEGLETS